METNTQPRHPRRAGWRAAFVAAVLCLPTGAATAADTAAPVAANAAPVPAALLEKLAHWLDTRSEYDRPATAPRIVFVSAAAAMALHGVADRSGGRLRGLYDPDTLTIYLTEPWSADKPRDVAVLVHELVHHRQAGQHWYCPQAQEWRAYQLQSQWLRSRGILDAFYWPAIVLQSSCAKRDIHPR